MCNKWGKWWNRSKIGVVLLNHPGSYAVGCVSGLEGGDRIYQFHRATGYRRNAIFAKPVECTEHGGKRNRMYRPRWFLDLCGRGFWRLIDTVYIASCGGVIRLLLFSLWWGYWLIFLASLRGGTVLKHCVLQKNSPYSFVRYNIETLTILSYVDVAPRK